MTAPTPCSEPNPCEDGEPCDRHEEEQAHAEGDHTFCGVTCEVEMPTEPMRNFVIARGYPGTAGALDELLRRARVAGRAEGIREAADLVGNDDDCTCGGCDTCVPRWYAAELRRRADGIAPPAARPQHLAKGANAEDCPACHGTNPPYPFLCPGPTEEPTS